MHKRIGVKVIQTEGQLKEQLAYLVLTKC